MRVSHILLLGCMIFVSAARGQEQHRSIHQQEAEFYAGQPEQAFKSQPVTPLRPFRLSKRTDLTHVIYGFHPYWKNGSESSYDFSLLTHLAYFSGDIDTATGGFTSTHLWSTASVVTSAKNAGVKVHFAVTLFGGHSAILNNNTKRQALISNILTKINERSADGCNVDFEAVSSTLKDSLRTFIVQLGTALHAAGKELVVELPAVDWSSGWVVYGNTFFSATSAVVDYYFLMAYDYYYGGSSNAGPVAPLTYGTSIWHCTRSIDAYLGKGCPAAKLVGGFPYYGYDWPVISSSRMAGVDGARNDSSRTYSVIRSKFIDTVAMSNQFFDATYNVPWYRYQNGGWRQVWYDDSVSLAKKYDSVKVRSLAGVGMWALGYDGTYDELWNLLRAKFYVAPPPPANTVIDSFETTVGHFDKAPTYSGTTAGISASSTAARTTTTAYKGVGSLQVVLKDNAGTDTVWTVRLLSGGGTIASNTAFGVTGYFGFWMKTSTASASGKVGLSIDDGAGGTLLSSKQSAINDGQWHSYQWNLGTTTWTILAGSDNVLNGPTATLDGVMFYADNGSPDWTLFIDDVSYNPSVPLPVTLAEFTAGRTGKGVELRWRTISETENAGFEVERRGAQNGWSSVGFVAGAGTSDLPHEYRFTDAVPEAGRTAYRLKLVANNGNTEYSTSVEVEGVALPNAPVLEQNYPNPFNPTTNFGFRLPASKVQAGQAGISDFGFVRVSIFDVLGREIAVLANEEKQAGRYTITWDASHLPSGTYFYTLRTGSTSITKKMMLVR